MKYRTSPALGMAVALAALFPLLSGCGGGGGGSSSTPVVSTPNPTPAQPAPDPTPTPSPVLSVSAPALSNFTVSLEQNTAAISAGGSITYILRLKNTSATSANIVPGTSGGQSVPQATLRITNAQGAVVYPVQQPGVSHAVPAPPAPPTVTGETTLAPGDQLTPITRTVSAFAAPGTYYAQAVFSVAATNADTPQTVTLPLLGIVVN